MPLSWREFTIVPRTRFNLLARCAFFRSFLNKFQASIPITSVELANAREQLLYFWVNKEPNVYRQGSP